MQSTVINIYQKKLRPLYDRQPLNLMLFLSQKRDRSTADADAVKNTSHEQQEQEQNNKYTSGFASLLTVEDGIVYKPEAEEHTRWYQRLLDAGLEENGIKPVPIEKRTNTQYNNLFTVFFTGLLCILPYVVAQTFLTWDL